MQNPTLKVGDKVRALNFCSATTFERGDILEITHCSYGYDALNLTNREEVWLDPYEDIYELVDDSSLPASTTTEQSVIDESQALVNALDEAIFYNGYNPLKPKAKAVEVLGALIHLLVDKGVLSSKDAQRILVKTNG